ncbi:PAS domain S-box protein [Brevundimonas subvibrioides]|uniref:histidine kinase n=1 Tax=Brevundimonas subvibrioides (strain ATCC 15264 / DSM 4735 / LMG 14903 / NBRC 16000 / CB 81) TaxID=633149 RepID=D9QLQ5_BRESC|nr:PAS domain S-box protein [Brevundimonas subvibrioides]ADK99988.1 multi-sensor signal transduction histidine kinase [Brevundimonas subvibrioides ATCC 15264]
MSRLSPWSRAARAWADLGLGSKGLIVLALPLAILLSGIGALHLSGRAEAEAEARVRLTFAIQRDIHEVHALLAEAASGVRGYRLTGRRAFLEPYIKAEALLPETLARLRQTTRDPEIRQRLARVDTLVVQKRRGLAQLAAMPGAGTAEGVEAPTVAGALVANKAVLDALRAEIDAMQRRESQLLEQRQAKADAERRRTWTLTAVLAGIGLLGGLAAAQLLFTGIVRRVRGLERDAERLERGEPLSLADEAQDEIGRLARRLVQAGDLLRSREAALREGEERYRRVIEGVRDYGIFALDLEGRVVSWNTGAERIKGWTADEILGQHFSTFYPAEARAETPMRLLEAARRDGRVEDEGWRVRRDGGRFWANVVITALHDETGTLTGFSKVTRDVTERRQAEEALGHARAEAERASRAKSDFLSRMSHELRTPLTAILGFNQLLGMDGETLTDDQRHGVDQISRAGGHLLAMIEEVLDIARIEAGGHALAPVPLDPAPLLADVRDLIAPQAQAAGVEVRIEGDAGLSVLADRRATVQIVLNLLSNAIKYGPAGGVVTVTLVGASGRVRIEVRDEGPGVPPELVDRLFIPFDRLDAERWSGAQGSGLGLALSRGLARAQGGEVSYHPPGATFILELPASPSHGQKPS